MTPAIVRALLYPAHEALMRRPTYSVLRSLEGSQWLDAQSFSALQLEKLRVLLNTAGAHSPWHADRMRSVGLTGATAGPLTWESFRRLPLMDRNDARVHRDRIAWLQVPGGAQRYNTGGSSGQPLVFYFGRQRQAADAASRIRARRWWGVDIGSREVFLWGAPIELNRTDRIKTFRDRLFNQLLLNAFDMSALRMDSYIDAINAYRPVVLYGYASSVALLCSHAATRGRSLRASSLRLVCTTGEPLLPHQRALIGSTFGVPVASEFGSRDGGFIAHESPNGQMLQCGDVVVLEVLRRDGTPCAPGEAGEAVITNLFSEAQPFIRYRTGDVVTMSSASCADGRGLPVIESVAGRTTDFVVRADGTIMHALALIYVMRAIPSVVEFRIEQQSLQDIDVQVVGSDEWTAAAADSALAGLQARLGADVRVVIRRVDAIAREGSGKHRYVVSRVPLPAGAEFLQAA